MKIKVNDNLWKPNTIGLRNYIMLVSFSIHNFNAANYSPSRLVQYIIVK